MKLSAVLCALAATSAGAFSVSPKRADMTMSATSDRRTAFTKIAGLATIVAAPGAAFADGAVSSATVNRAKGIYGSRIANLKGAVEAGDFKAVVDEKNAFVLYNSGAFPGIKNKAAKSAAVDATNAIFAAIRSKDQAALKSAYSAYIATAGVSPMPTVGTDGGQGYSSDYDFKARTSAGAIYVR